MKRLIVILFSMFFMLIICDNTQKNKESFIKEKKSYSNRKDINEINIEPIEINEDTIMECRHLASLDRKALKQKRYIYFSNLTDYVLIKINGNKMLLKKDTLNSKMISEKSYKEVFTNKNCKTILQFNLYNEEEESYNFKGTIEIVYKKQRIKINVIGKGGC